MSFGCYDQRNRMAEAAPNSSSDLRDDPTDRPATALSGMVTTALDLDQLAADTVWLRRLARALVADPAAADDIVQDTYLIAATDAPRDGRPLRPWMVRVLWNRIRMRSRSAQRSARRDEAFAKLAEPPATPEAIVDRLVTQRMLTGLVLALEPLYRDVLVLHYFEGLTSTEIGNRLGIAAGTVRWRLKQAIDQLRARLDERQPNRAWVAGIAGLAHGGDAVPFAVSKLVAAAIVGAIALAIIALPGSVASPSPPPPPPRERVAAPMLAPAGGAPHATATDPAPDELRTDDLRHLAGTVIDNDDAPAAGATVTLDCHYEDDPTRPTMQTGPDGRFAFEVDPACQPKIWATRGDAAGLAHQPRHDPGPLRLRLVAQPYANLHIVDAETGQPIAGADVVTSGEFGAADHQVSDATGLARIRWIGWLTFAKVRAPGYVALDDTVQERSGFKLIGDRHGERMERTFRLSHGIAISGISVHRDGTPIAGAMITVADVKFNDSTTTDDHGRFQLAVPHIGEYSIEATSPRAHSDDSALDESLTVPAAGRRDIVVHVSVHGELHGTVLDATGMPAAGATVAPSQGQSRPVTTDSFGRFVLHRSTTALDLVARRGDLASSFVHVDRNAHDVTLVLGRAGIRGTVVDSSGEPIPHATVWLNACCENGIVMSGRGRTADEKGHFAFDEVPAGEFVLSARTPDDDEYDEGNDLTVTSGDRDVRLVVR